MITGKEKFYKLIDECIKDKHINKLMALCPQTFGFKSLGDQYYPNCDKEHIACYDCWDNAISENYETE